MVEKQSLSRRAAESFSNFDPLGCRLGANCWLSKPKVHNSLINFLTDHKRQRSRAFKKIRIKVTLHSADQERASCGTKYRPVLKNTMKFCDLQSTDLKVDRKDKCYEGNRESEAVSRVSRTDQPVDRAMQSLERCRRVSSSIKMDQQTCQTTLRNSGNHGCLTLAGRGRQTQTIISGSCISGQSSVVSFSRSFIEKGHLLQARD